MSQKRLLRERDYTFILARSADTWSPQHPYHREWADAQGALVRLAKKCWQYDANGLTLYLAAKPYRKVRGAEVVRLAQGLQQQGRSPQLDVLGCLRDALRDYFARRGTLKSLNGEMIFIVVDAIPAAKDDLVKAIVKATQVMYATTSEPETNYELGIGFVQVGNDPETQKFLTFLDDELQSQGARDDIVDAKFWYDIGKGSLDDFLVNVLLD